jgi:hypothetical protein
MGRHLSIKYQLPILNPSKSVPIADDKTEGPSTWITYLGLLIDTEKMLIQIPDEKVQELLYFIGTPNSEQTSVKVFINFEQLLVLSAPANKKSSR